MNRIGQQSRISTQNQVKRKEITKPNQKKQNYHHHWLPELIRLRNPKKKKRSLVAIIIVSHYHFVQVLLTTIADIFCKNILQSFQLDQNKNQKKTMQKEKKFLRVNEWYGVVFNFYDINMMMMKNPEFSLCRI